MNWRKCPEEISFHRNSFHLAEDQCRIMQERNNNNILVIEFILRICYACIKPRDNSLCSNSVSITGRTLKKNTYVFRILILKLTRSINNLNFRSPPCQGPQSRRIAVSFPFVRALGATGDRLLRSIKRIKGWITISRENKFNRTLVENWTDHHEIWIRTEDVSCFSFLIIERNFIRFTLSTTTLTRHLITNKIWNA